jgi:hypothetical protein
MVETEAIFARNVRNMPHVAEPLFNALPEPNKIVVYEGGH